MIETDPTSNTSVARFNQFTLRSLAIVMVVIAAMAALYVPMISRTLRANHSRICATHLRLLWQESLYYHAQYGRAGADFPEGATGSEVFLRNQRGPRSITITGRYDHFFCPRAGEEPGPGRTSYRGPSKPLFGMLPYPVAADKEGNHGGEAGGNVLLSTGDCREVEASDGFWIQARTTTKE